MKILFHLPTRSRPEKAHAAIRNIIDNCISDDYVIFVTADRNDLSMNGFESIYLHNNNVIVEYGNSKSKIDACNRDIELVKEWDILVNTSDDMSFVVKGFDHIIENSFFSYQFNENSNIKFGNINLDQFIHFNDGNQKSNVCTLSIMGREYYERFGYVYHPSYKSLWCDCEATEVAYMLGKYRYMGDDNIIFRHYHPAWGLAEYDEQYKKTEGQDMWDFDKQIIEKRRTLNYELPLNELVNGFKYGQL